MFRLLVLPIVLTSVTGVVGQAPQNRDYHDKTESIWNRLAHGPLPRWREGGTPEPDPNRPMIPYAVDLTGGIAAVPTSGVIASPPEYAASDGVLFWYDTQGWPQVVTECVAALTGDPTHDEIAYVIIPRIGQQSPAELQFQEAGADLSKVQFLVVPSYTIWIRDYGPHYIWQDGARAIVDSHYYPERDQDNFVPTRLAEDHFQIPSYDIGLYYSGGNFQPGPGRTGFTTSLVHVDNPGFGEAFVGELMQTYQGIDTLYILPQLPTEVDATGHIDMWFYLVDEDTVIISEFIPGSDPEAITITNEAAAFMENALGFEVFRVPAFVGRHPDWSFFPTHFTYTNAFRVNDRIFVPTYGQGAPSHLERDTQALAAWQAAAPDAEIVPINCFDIIYAAGAIHCIVMQVPRHESPIPSACVTSPNGGELLAWNSSPDIAWAATDDEQISAVDLYFSVDGGSTYEEPIALAESNDGHFEWIVPQVATTEAVVRVVARDVPGNETEAVSAGPFVIADARQHVYDFSSGAGVDKWGWGHQTIDWSELDGTRRPASVGTEISVLVADAYAKLAYADAEGALFDPNRYRSPVPPPNGETTHIFEFIIEETPGEILDIGLLWEGYGDSCTQMELYVWDYAAGQWANHQNQHGENRYVDNQAAARDGILSGHLRSGFSRYLGPDRKLTLLLYGERPGEESLHDYMAVVVTFGDAPELVPAVSEWGMTVLSLLMLMTGTLIVRNREIAASCVKTVE